MKTILIIDDQADNLISTKAVIINNLPNCRVLTALSGKEGIDIARKEDPDIILLDIIMPVMDGYETCKELKKDNLTTHIPVIMITAVKTDSKSRVKALNLGADAFISKPIDSVELTAQVNVMLRIREAEKKLRAEKKGLEETVLKRTRKLKESESRYRMISNLTSDYLYHEKINSDGSSSISWISGSFEIITGYTVEEYNSIGGWKALLHKDHFETDRKEFEKLSKNNSSISEVQIIHKNGNPIWIKSYAHPVWDENSNRLKGVVGAVEDITERKLAELALHQNEHIVSSSTDMMALLDANFIYLAANKAYIDTLKLSSEQLIGKTVTAVFGEDFFTNIIKPHAIRCLSGEKVNYQDWFEFPDTGPKFMDINYYPYYTNTKKISGFVVNGRDITERKKAEDALAKSELHYRVLFENSPIPMWEEDFSEVKKRIDVLKKKGVKNFRQYFEDRPKLVIELANAIKIIEINQPVLELHEAKTKDELFEGLSKIFTTDSYKSFIGEIVAIAEGRTKDEFVGAVRTLKGKIKYVQLKWTVVPGYEETLERVYVSTIDITERVVAEKTIQRSEQKYKDLFEKSEDAVLIISNEKFVDCNQATVKMLGYENKNQLLKTHPSVLSPEKQPDGRLSFEKAKEMMNIAHNKGSYRFEWMHKKADGEVFPVEVLLTSITSSDGNKIIHTVWRDITNRKRAELMQRVLFNISNAVLTFGNLKKFIRLIQKELGTIIDTKNYYIAIYDEESDMISLPFMADEKGDTAEVFPARKTMTGYVIKKRKSLLLTSTQQEKLVEKGIIDFVGPRSKVWLGVPLKIKEKITGVLAIQSYKDENAYGKSDVEILEFIADQISISIDRIKSEEDLKNALEKATEADKLKSSFLATMSHELRTPLNAIIGFSDIVSDDLSIEEIVDYCKTINSSGTHLLKIVEELFDITLIESGEVKINKENVEISALLHEVHEIITVEKVKTGKNQLEVIKIIPPNVENLVINTDPSKLKQILINLIKNAIKFTETGHVKYGFKILKQGKKSMFEFFIEDTGIGIQIDKQEFIFDIFRQVEDSHTRIFGGTGIGLSISKKLTELLGGEIRVESTEGIGSSFYFTIPYEEGCASKKIMDIESINISEKSKKAEDKKNTILVVEDVEPSFEFLKIILEKFGYKILWAKNGEEAIKQCKENSIIDLVLMDINMPKMNGYEATKAIKEFRPYLPIIAQTAYAIAGDRKKSLLAGCDDYITKPVKQMVLIEIIKKYL